jgi:predicted NBD/HSP70 family sugar kinase
MSRRHQKPVYHPRTGERLKRIAIGSAVHADIERAIHQTTTRFNVSRSFVVAVALADYFGIPIDRYNDAETQPRRKRRRV